MMKTLGWLEYEKVEGRRREVILPPTRLGDLVQHVKERMGLEHIRYIGNPDAIVSRIGFCGHLLPGADSNWSNNAQVAASWDYDVVIPGETVDWTLPLYIRDAADLGKAMAMNDTEGFVKIIADKDTDAILGVHIVGPHATDLIAEASPAMLMECTARELGRAIHAHPTLGEAMMEAAHAVHGECAHMPTRRR